MGYFDYVLTKPVNLQRLQQWCKNYQSTFEACNSPEVRGRRSEWRQSRAKAAPSLELDRDRAERLTN